VAGRNRSAAIRQSLSTLKPCPELAGDVRLSVVIPAYRESERIAQTIERVRGELGGLMDPGDLEVVVVDDGSGDGTDRAARPADIVIAVPVNRGKGAAVRAGMLAASGRVRAFTDADLSYAPAQLLSLTEKIEQGWDVVVGSRLHPDTTTTARASRVREAGSRMVNGATRLVLAGHHADTQCGIKAFRSDVAETVFSAARVDGFAFDVEVFMLAERLGLSLIEVPVEVENSDRSTVRVARDAARLLVDLAAIRIDMARGRYDEATRDLPGLVD